MIIRGTNIEMVRGDTEDILVSMKDHNGRKVNLINGDKLYITVKHNAGDTSKQFQKVTTTFKDGEGVLKILPGDTKPMEFGRYVYDIQLTRSNGEVKTIVPFSHFVIVEEVTHE